MNLMHREKKYNLPICNYADHDLPGHLQFFSLHVKCTILNLTV